MTFIEISPTVCVNVNQIAWVSQVDDGLSSTIYVGGKEYPSDIPYASLVQIIQSTDNSSTMDKLDKYLSVATIQTP